MNQKSFGALQNSLKINLPPEIKFQTATGALKHLWLSHKIEESTLARAIDAQTFFISLPSPAATCTASRA